MTDNWISVNDRMPPEHDGPWSKLKRENSEYYTDNLGDQISDDYRVIFQYEDGRRVVSHDRTIDGKWSYEKYKFLENYPEYKGKVTHWMENPPLPEESGD